ncbi:hypothetical protein ABFS82_05G048800 [Erythranthe guttata]|nr:PREDICTED: putative clathrin assembly protein At2g25430 [Erythranthe guttata]|eukprot:XP_012846139.1 PREDICTED: putative clathrin assembly protein At2g25430 [Erythranthe guttata]
MQKRIRQVFTTIREHTRVSYAKIATIGGYCDIDLIIVKATSPDDTLVPDKYVHELLKIFSISPCSSHRAFALSFTRRFTGTHSWRVALKCLILLHRLLRSLPNNTPFRAELMWARTNGRLSLYPCNFRDRSSSASDDYTSFVRSYARLLDEALDCVSLDEQVRETLYLEDEDEEQEEELEHKMQQLGRIIEILPQLQSLIDRVIECWPGGSASRNFLVESAMKQVIRHGFACHAAFRREIVVVLENLTQLPYRNCVAAFGIYKKAAVQADHLSGFHEWCKCMGYCGPYEYPFIDRIPGIQIRALETFLNGMWQLTDESSNSSATNVEHSPASICGDKRAGIGEGFDEQVVAKKEKEIEALEPLLIQWEDSDDENYNNSSVGWEDLLEASICGDSWLGSRNGKYEGNIGWEMQLYSPHVLQIANPFHQDMQKTNFYCGSCPNTPMVTWELL